MSIEDMVKEFKKFYGLTKEEIAKHVAEAAWLTQREALQIVELYY